MKRFRMFLTISIVGTLVLYAARATAQTDTTFAYQGRLDQNGQPVNGMVNLDFALFDAAVGGNQINAEIMFNSVPIIDGLFTVDLDFGAAAFDNSNRWLRIKVNNTTLSPRQPVSRSPYAIQTRGMFVDEMQNVGIGTTTPAAQLHVAANRPALRLQDDDNATSFALFDDSSAGQMRINKVADATISLIDINPMIVNGISDAHVRFFRETGTTGDKSVIFHSGNNTNATSAVIGVDGNHSSFQLDGGNFSIGTANPILARLHIEATGTRALFAHNTGATGFGSGVTAQSETSVGRAIEGINLVGGFAGYFLGPVAVCGNLTKTSGSFKIDHPLDPANKYLYHSFVESPDMMNIYNGNIVSDEKGFATIEMPEWFDALNREFRYQLTVIDEESGNDFVQTKVVQGIQNNQFRIRTSAPGTTVSWQVTGVRQDAWAEAHRIPVEEDKVGNEIGRYLHPEVYGLDRSMSVESAREAMIDEQQEVESDQSEFHSDTEK